MRATPLRARANISMTTNRIRTASPIAKSSIGVLSFESSSDHAFPVCYPECHETISPIPTIARPKIATGKSRPISGLRIAGCSENPSGGRNFHTIAKASTRKANPIATFISLSLSLTCRVLGSGNFPKQDSCERQHHHAPSNHVTNVVLAIGPLKFWFHFRILQPTARLSTT
jgi:hypothetical protein